MLRIIEEPKEEKPRIIEMKDMKPLQVGRIISAEWNGHIVFRTSSTSHFEVMDLSNPFEDSDFDMGAAADWKVELLPPGEKITIELFNEE